jgi:Polyketide cyclase / dehydrase and lipid transport
MPRTFELSGSRLASCEPEKVLGLVADATKWPAWQPEITSIAGPESMVAGDVARGKARMLGFHVDGHATAVDVDRAYFVQDVIVGVRMEIRYEVKPIEGGTMITHTLSAHLPRGFSGRVLALFLRRRLRWLQRTALENLVRQSEAGTSS